MNKVEVTLEDKKKLIKIAALLEKARSVLFITGAGLSAESGLPTYRGIGGLYEEKGTGDELPIEVILSDQMISMNPTLTWKSISEMEKICRGARYSTAHKIIKDFEQKVEKVIVLTQNVDGLHHQAGSRQVIDIHGDFRKLYCMNKKCTYELEVSDYSSLSIPPKCPACGNWLRPDVVLFGEQLPIEKLNTLLHELAEGFDMIFTIGTYSLFPYISRPVTMAKQNGIPIVEINPGFTMVSDIVTYKIKATAGEALRELYSLMTSHC